MSAPSRPAPAADRMLELAASVFYHSRDGMMITGLDGNILAVNRAFSAITGYAEHEVVGRNPRLLKSGRQDADFYRTMWDAIVREGHWQGEAWNRRKDGSHFAERITIAMVPDADGRPHHYIAVFADITRASEQRRLLEQRSNFDPLTGLPNRLLLQERLTRALGRGEQAPVALAFIDLDGFKAVNDQLGHFAGDQLLVTMAQRLQGALRDSDTLARFGGDEFVAVLPDVQDHAMLAARIDRLMAAARAPILIEQQQLRLSASIGVALSPRDGSDPEQLIRKADEAMYRAKRSGRNCVCASGADGAITQESNAGDIATRGEQAGGSARTCTSSPSGAWVDAGADAGDGTQAYADDGRDANCGRDANGGR